MVVVVVHAAETRGLLSGQHLRQPTIDATSVPRSSHGFSQPSWFLLQHICPASGCPGRARRWSRSRNPVCARCGSADARRRQWIMGDILLGGIAQEVPHPRHRRSEWEVSFHRLEAQPRGASLERGVDGAQTLSDVSMAESSAISSSAGDLKCDVVRGNASWQNGFRKCVFCDESCLSSNEEKGAVCSKAAW